METLSRQALLRVRIEQKVSEMSSAVDLTLRTRFKQLCTPCPTFLNTFGLDFRYCTHSDIVTSGGLEDTAAKCMIFPISGLEHGSNVYSNFKGMRKKIIFLEIVTDVFSNISIFCVQC